MDAETAEAIRHLRWKIVELWCTKSLDDPEARRLGKLIIGKIQKLRGERSFYR